MHQCDNEFDNNIVLFRSGFMWIGDSDGDIMFNTVFQASDKKRVKVMNGEEIMGGNERRML